MQARREAKSFFGGLPRALIGAALLCFLAFPNLAQSAAPPPASPPASETAPEAATPAAAPLLSGDARSLFATAERLRFAEDWYGAVEAYLAVLSKNPSYGDALAGLAECYYELEEYDQALSYARRAAPFLRGDGALADLEGFIRLGSADLAGARKIFETVLAAKPNDLDARFGMTLLDLAAGRRTEARSRLEESLRLSPQNGRALLSLALIASDQGRDTDARSLVEKALRWHGSEPRTQYVAARLAAAAGERDRAAFYARNALDLKPSYAEARLLLGSLMYESASYDQAIALMREAVAQNRKDGMAWYTLGLAQSGAGRTADAIYSLRTATTLRPDDEIVRIKLENIVTDSSPAEDTSREAYADWHFKRGTEFEDRSLYDQALFEYRRGLGIYPYSKRGRVLYAGLLKARGYPGKYLAELQFLKDNGKADQSVLDAIEIYDSLLSDAVGRSWSVDESALPKRPYKLALMYKGAPEERLHAAGEEVLLRYLKDILASSSRLAVLSTPAKVSSLSEAFRRAREAEADYFVLLSSKETERDVEVSAELRVARTGSPAASFNAYRTGNDRVKNTVSRIADLLVGALPPEGRILARNQDVVLVDLGKADGVAVGAKLVVLKQGGLQPKAEGLGQAYAASDVLGEMDVTRVGEEVSEGTLKRAGFFDTVNVGDELVLPPPANTAAKGSPPPSSAPAPEFPGLFTAVQRLR